MCDEIWLFHNYPATLFLADRSRLKEFQLSTEESEPMSEEFQLRLLSPWQEQIATHSRVIILPPYALPTQPYQPDDSGAKAVFRDGAILYGNFPTEALFTDHGQDPAPPESEFCSLKASRRAITHPATSFSYFDPGVVGEDQALQILFGRYCEMIYGDAAHFIIDLFEM